MSTRSTAPTSTPPAAWTSYELLLPRPDSAVLHGRVPDALSTRLADHYDQRVAARWGELQAYPQLRSRQRPVNDSWIAACCLVGGQLLAAFNVKDCGIRPG